MNVQTIANAIHINIVHFSDFLISFLSCFGFDVSEVVSERLNPSSGPGSNSRNTFLNALGREAEAATGCVNGHLGCWLGG